MGTNTRGRRKRRTNDQAIEHASEKKSDIVNGGGEAVTAFGSNTAGPGEEGSLTDLSKLVVSGS